VVKTTWWILVVTALSTGNRPDAVPFVFKYVLEKLEKVQADFGVFGEKAHEEKLLLARKFRDVLFKSGMVAGYSKVSTCSTDISLNLHVLDMLLYRPLMHSIRCIPACQKIYVIPKLYGTSISLTIERSLHDRYTRNTSNVTLSDLEKKGQEVFGELYGTTADGVQKLLDSIYPDMGKQAIGYEHCNNLNR
jgi:hypothetical protein